MTNNVNKEAVEQALPQIHDEEITKLFIDYLYDFFPVYQGIKDKPWTRENELDAGLPNTEQNQSLRKLLTNPDTISVNQKNIIFFRGETEGDGKKFYLSKLMETCYEAIPHFVWSDIEKIEKSGWLFRIPVLVDKCSADNWLSNESKCSRDIIGLTAQCFLTKLNLNSSEQQTIAEIFARSLVQKGRLALFITEDACSSPLEFMQRLLPLPSSVETLPIMIFLVDHSFSPEIFEGEYAQFYCVDIKPLSEYQILRYIAIELPNHPELIYAVKQHKEIMGLLSKQERLLKQISIWKKELDVTDLELDILQVERDFIDEITNNNESLHDKLCEAAKLELQGKLIPQETLDSFANTNFFNFSNGQFNYAESRYYLIAEEYSKRRFSVSDICAVKKVIGELIRKWPLEVQFYFAAFYIQGVKTERRRKERLDIYFNALCGAFSEPDLRKRHSPALVIAETLLFINKVMDKYNDFLKWTIRELENSTYDENVYEALLRLCSVIPSNQIETALCENYLETKNPEVKRRIVYFYSFARYPVPDEIVTDLADENNEDKHLKYHIVSALIDTYDVPEVEEAKWMKHSEYFAWLEKDNDPILQSEFEKLFFLKTNSPYRSEGVYLMNGTNFLVEIISTGEDWEKAHAASALCRREVLGLNNYLYIINQLRNVLLSEVENLCEYRERNCLKTISYIVKACCTLAINESQYPKIKECVQNIFVELIKKIVSEYMNPNEPFEIYIIAHTSILLLTCGLINLKNGKLSFRRLLSEPFSPESMFTNLLHDHGIISVSELWSDDNALELEDILQKLDMQPSMNFSPLVNIKYDVSVGQIYIDGKSVGMGFMLRENRGADYRIYCITCAHLFGGADTEKIEFKPLGPEEKSKTYALKLLYPTKERLAKAPPVEAHAKEDISIWALENVAYDVFTHIFDKNDWCDVDKKMNTPLKSYGFPDKNVSVFGDAHGKPLEYEHHGDVQNGFCVFNIQNEQFDAQQSKSKNIYAGYSGAPIVDSDGKIYAMHKGNADKDKLIGIKVDIIKKILLEKEWEQHGSTIN